MIQKQFFGPIWISGLFKTFSYRSRRPHGKRAVMLISFVIITSENGKKALLLISLEIAKKNQGGHSADEISLNNTGV